MHIYSNISTDTQNTIVLCRLTIDYVTFGWAMALMVLEVFKMARDFKKYFKHHGFWKVDMSICMARARVCVCVGGWVSVSVSVCMYGACLSI